MLARSNAVRARSAVSADSARPRGVNTLACVELLIFQACLSLDCCRTDIVRFTFLISVTAGYASETVDPCGGRRLAADIWRVCHGGLESWPSRVAVPSPQFRIGHVPICLHPGVHRHVFLTDAG